MTSPNDSSQQSQRNQSFSGRKYTISTTAQSEEAFMEVDLILIFLLCTFITFGLVGNGMTLLIGKLGNKCRPKHQLNNLIYIHLSISDILGTLSVPIIFIVDIKACDIIPSVNQVIETVFLGTIWLKVSLVAVAIIQRTDQLKNYTENPNNLLLQKSLAVSWGSTTILSLILLLLLLFSISLSWVSIVILVMAMTLLFIVVVVNFCVTQSYREQPNDTSKDRLNAQMEIVLRHTASTSQIAGTIVFISNLPNLIYSAICLIHDQSIFTTTNVGNENFEPGWTDMLLKILAISHHPIQPLIYVTRSKEFRLKLLQLLRLRQEQQQHNSAEKEEEFEQLPGGISSVSNAVSFAEASEVISEHEITQVETGRAGRRQSDGENRMPFRIKSVSTWKRSVRSATSNVDSIAPPRPLLRSSTSTELTALRKRMIICPYEFTCAQVKMHVRQRSSSFNIRILERSRMDEKERQIQAAVRACESRNHVTHCNEFKVRILSFKESRSPGDATNRRRLYTVPSRTQSPMASKEKEEGSAETKEEGTVMEKDDGTVAKGEE